LHIPQLPPETIDAVATFLCAAPDTLREWLASEYLHGVRLGAWTVVGLAFTKKGRERVRSVCRSLRPKPIVQGPPARWCRVARHDDNPKLPF
jgi:hypothetical protein